MRLTVFPLLVAATQLSWLTALSGDANASTRPHFGGTLRVELQAASVSLDPREWRVGSEEFATNEKLGALVFDRLVLLDNYGRFKPQLAVEWSHDSTCKRWQFVLRAGAKFSDGSALTAADVAAAFQPLLPSGQQITASGNTVAVESSQSMPDMLEELASARFFVYRVRPDGTLIGSGPFFEADTPAANKPQKLEHSENSNAPAPFAGKLAPLHFRANEGTWSGRPFLDAIEVTLGVPPLRQLFDLQLGKADVIEVAPDLVRRATQENQRVWASSPVTLYALAFDDPQADAAASEAKLREAVSLALDRHTMASVLLQKQAEPATALLPQWLSGYAFLFPMETSLDRAKEIRSTLAAKASSAEPLHLRVDATGDLAKLLGERVAVNVRQAAIPVRVSYRALGNASQTITTPTHSLTALRLFAWRYSSLSPRVELETFVSALNLESPSEDRAAADLEHLYAREQKLLQERRVLPLVALPEYAGLGRNVRDWMPSKWAEWHLADVWLDLPESAPAANSENAELPTLGRGARP